MIYYYGKRYEQLGRCARESFIKFHPDVSLHHINEKNQEDLRCSAASSWDGAIFKYMAAYELMIKHKYDKMIILGADTITCDRLDEFINGKEDILVTLGYRPPDRHEPRRACADHFVDHSVVYHLEERERAALTIPYRLHPYYVFDKKTGWKIDTMCVTEEYNSDVVCFNNPAALKAVIEKSHAHRHVLMNRNLGRELEIFLKEKLKIPFFVGPGLYHDEYTKFLKKLVEEDPSQPVGLVEYYAEMAGLNIVTFLDDFTFRCVDGPYDESDVIYNVRAKGNVSPHIGEKPWAPYVKEFYVKEDKLYTGDDKQIKVWHYCEGFGRPGLEVDDFVELLNLWIGKWFNKETKDFFTNHCDCGDFFQRENFTW